MFCRNSIGSCSLIHTFHSEQSPWKSASDTVLVLPFLSFHYVPAAALNAPNQGIHLFQCNFPAFSCLLQQFLSKYRGMHWALKHNYLMTTMTPNFGKQGEKKYQWMLRHLINALGFCLFFKEEEENDLFLVFKQELKEEKGNKQWSLNNIKIHTLYIERLKAS